MIVPQTATPADPSLPPKPLVQSVHPRDDAALHAPSRRVRVCRGTNLQSRARRTADPQQLDTVRPHSLWTVPSPNGSISMVRRDLRSGTSTQTASSIRWSAKSRNASWAVSPKPDTPITRSLPTRAEMRLPSQQSSTVPAGRVRPCKSPGLTMPSFTTSYFAAFDRAGSRDHFHGAEAARGEPLPLTASDRGPPTSINAARREGLFLTGQPRLPTSAASSRELRPVRRNRRLQPGQSPR